MKKWIVLALLVASPVSAQNHADVVQQVAAEAPAEKTLEGALQFTVRVVTRLNALYPNERAGLLVKPSGENVIPYSGTVVSAGRICYPNGQLFKVLTDVPTTNGPSWQDNGTVDPSRYLAVTAAPPVVLPPTLPAVQMCDLSGVLAKLDDVKQAVDDGRGENQDNTKAIRGDIADFREAVKSKWAAAMKFGAKYILPAVAGIIGGWKMK